MASNNSLLLFGDYGPEVIKLSDLYDPSKARYRRTASGDIYSAGTQYYLPVIKPNRMIEFQSVSSADVYKDHTGRLLRHYWYDTGTNDQNGKYVPAEKSLVIVDEIDGRWGTYTLLVVDSVDDDGDDPTYQSVLVPINFAGGIDLATRAIDYNNNSMMLYVEDVEGGGQRLIPDRKLMMYGPHEIKYYIKMNIDGFAEVINTNAMTGPENDRYSYGDYITASSTAVKVSSQDIYKSLAGKTVVFYDNLDNKQTFTVEVTTNASGTLIGDSVTQYDLLHSAYVAGREIYVESDSNDVLSHVHVPRPCYLKRSMNPLVSGATVEFFAYEKVADTSGGASSYREIFASKLTVKAGASSYSADPTEKVIVGFGVRRTSETTDTSDVWEMDAASAKMLDYVAYLKYDDGSIGELQADDNCLFVYGKEQFNRALNTGEEIDILFKYFPNRAHGIKNHDAYEGRYVRAGYNVGGHSHAVVQRPLSYMQYFIKNSSGEFVLANGDGHPTEFETGVQYYIHREKFAWDAAVARPTRDVLVCRKRVRIISNASRDVSKITMIPVWNNDNKEWSFNYLVYKKNFSRPKLLIDGISDDETVVMNPKPDTLPLHSNGSFDNTNYDVSLNYSGSVGAPDATKALRFMIQHWTNRAGSYDRWLFAWDGSSVALNSASIDPIPYGRDGDSYVCRRPYINCTIQDIPGSDDKYGKFAIPNDTEKGFPISGSVNYFLKNFFEPYLTASDSSILSRVDNGTEVIVKPTHFIVRSATDSDVCTNMIKVENYADEFVLEGLELPTATCDGICVVEFLYNNEYLFGVPVEIRLKQTT